MSAKKKHKTFNTGNLTEVLAGFKKSLREQYNKRNALNTEINNLKSKIDELEERLKRENKKLEISDHATIRYLERIAGFNVDTWKKEILQEAINSKCNILGSGTVPLPRINCKVIMQDNVIVSIIPLERRKEFYG